MAILVIFVSFLDEPSSHVFLYANKERQWNQAGNLKIICILGVYKSYWPQLNRTLRSSSVPRRVPELDTSKQPLTISALPLVT
jgi:hypothetical protein